MAVAIKSVSFADIPSNLAGGTVVLRKKMFFIAGTASAITDGVTLSTYDTAFTSSCIFESVAGGVTTTAGTAVAGLTHQLSGITYGSGSVVPGTITTGQNMFTVTGIVSY